jgi:uncharacterized protein (DUF1330 family)
VGRNKPNLLLCGSIEKNQIGDTAMPSRLAIVKYDTPQKTQHIYKKTIYTFFNKDRKHHANVAQQVDSE